MKPRKSQKIIVSDTMAIIKGDMDLPRNVYIAEGYCKSKGHGIEGKNLRYSLDDKCVTCVKRKNANTKGSRNMEALNHFEERALADELNEWWDE